MLEAVSDATRLTLRVLGEQDWTLLEQITHGDGVDGYVFQRLPLLRCWLDTYGQKLRVTAHFFVFEDTTSGGMLVFPLSIRRLRGIKVLTTLGGFHADYSGALLIGPSFGASPEALWARVLDWAASHGVDVVSVRRLPQKIANRDNPLLFAGCLPCEQTGQLHLPEGWDGFYQTQMKTRLRADIRRQQKRLNEIGETAFVLPATLEEALALTDIMIEQKRERYRDMGITDQFRHDAAKHFYRKATQELWSRGLVHVAALRVGTDIVATHWGAVLGERFYYLMPAHAGAHWSRYSPGKVLLQHLVQWAAEHRCAVFDFTTGAEGYKAEWCDASLPLYRFEKPVSWLGALAMQALAMRDHARVSPVAATLRRWGKRVAGGSVNS